MVASVGTSRNPSTRGISGSLRAGAVSGSIAMMLVIGVTVTAQRAPQARDEVARPAASCPGTPGSRW